jgi:uncharacterized protein YcbX
MSDATLLSLWRYPVKSMQGEEINASAVTFKGLLGDRAYALMDAEDGKTVTAKNPKKWPTMFQFRAAFAEPSMETVPPVRITTPDGIVLDSRQADLNAILSQALGRTVTLEDMPPAEPHLDEYWPDAADVPGLPHTLEALRDAYPAGRFEARRFRPNLMVDAGSVPFAENAWIGRTISIGEEVKLSITGPCPRCIMTTLPQGDLPKDPGILRAAVQHNGGNVGIYASVLQGGVIRRGDLIRVE